MVKGGREGVGGDAWGGRVRVGRGDVVRRFGSFFYLFGVLAG